MMMIIIIITITIIIVIIIAPERGKNSDPKSNLKT